MWNTANDELAKFYEYACRSLLGKIVRPLNFVSFFHAVKIKFCTHLCWLSFLLQCICGDLNSNHGANYLTKLLELLSNISKITCYLSIFLNRITVPRPRRSDLWSAADCVWNGYSVVGEEIRDFVRWRCQINCRFKTLWTRAYALHNKLLGIGLTSYKQICTDWGIGIEIFLLVPWVDFRKKQTRP